MTFKHNKFYDSPTLRSLVKVATEKGWIKHESIEKTAEDHSDLAPTKNLTENIIKLCSGLRKAGMYLTADEIEKKFLVYKAANNSLYDVSGEEGKDLIDAAHPKGSYKLKDVDGDAVIETILDKHLKMLDMINKKPSGKLASHKDILRSVKIILAEEEITDADRDKKAREFLQTGAGLISKAIQDNQIKVTAPVAKGRADSALKSAQSKLAAALAASMVTSRSISDVISELDNALSAYSLNITPGVGDLSLLTPVTAPFGLGKKLIEGVTDVYDAAKSDSGESANQAIVKASINSAKLRMWDAKNSLAGKNDHMIKADKAARDAAGASVARFTERMQALVHGDGGPARMGKTVVMSKDSAQVFRTIAFNVKQITNWINSIEVDPDFNDAEKTAAKHWLAGKKTALEDLRKKFSALDDTAPGEDPEEGMKKQSDLASAYMKAINALIKDFPAFKAKWVG